MQLPGHVEFLLGILDKVEQGEPTEEAFKQWQLRISQVAVFRNSCEVQFAIERAVLGSQSSDATGGVTILWEDGILAYSTAHSAVAALVFYFFSAACLDGEEAISTSVNRLRRDLQSVPTVDLWQWKLRLASEWATARSYFFPIAENAIPPEHRSKPLTKKKLAALLGRPNEDSGVKWLNNCIADGIFRCEKYSRQSYVFDLREFDAAVQNQIRPGNSRPTPANSR